MSIEPRHPLSPQGEFVISYEFFPPRTPEMEAQLWETITRLAPLKPRFVSVTYGAGGTTRERTHAIVARLVRETDMKPAAHLTCVSASRAEIDPILRDYWDVGVRHIVALRGDPPGGVGTAFEPHPGGYASSTELVRGIRAHRRFRSFGFDLSRKASRKRLHRKRSRRARSARSTPARRAPSRSSSSTTTSICAFSSGRGRAGITIPIVPGIMPVRNFRQVAGFAKKAGASVPQWLADRFDGLDDDPETRAFVAASTAVEQVLDLVKAGVERFSFLHQQPRRSRLYDLPFARRASPS